MIKYYLTNEHKNLYKINNIDKHIGQYETIEEKNLFTITRRDNILIASICFNAGAVEIYKLKIDTDFTLDENLNDFIEYIEEQETKTPL